MPSGLFTRRDGQGVGVGRVIIAHAELWHEAANHTSTRHNSAGHLPTDTVAHLGYLHALVALRRRCAMKPPYALILALGCATASSLAVAQQHHTAVPTSDDELIKSAMSAA